MLKQSRRHLQENNERYLQHQRFALRYAWNCLQAAFMAAVHGVIPAFFQTSASEKVRQLANRSREE